MLESLKLRKIRLQEQKNLNENNSTGTVFCTSVFIISFLFNMILDKVFNLDPYKSFIILNKPVILIVIPSICIVLLGITVYKKQFNMKY